MGTDDIIGRVVEGGYRIEERLGAGGMATVYLDTTPYAVMEYLEGGSLDDRLEARAKEGSRESPRGVGHGNYAGAPADGTAWTAGGSRDRVYRGGSWGSDAADCRSAFLCRLSPDSRLTDHGFRPALSLPSEE